MTQLSFSGVGLDFGANALLSDITFTIAARERWGVVGRNGTGKTTLFRLLTGEMEPTRGSIARQPGLRVSLLEQHRDFGNATMVWEAAAGELADLLALEQSLLQQATTLATDSSDESLARYARDLERFEHEGGYSATARIDAVLHGLGFDPAKARGTPVSVLSGGERGRLGIVRQLVSRADVILLDEPTNHLDLDTTQWLEGYLRETDRTVLLISHDRAFLDAVVDHVLHLEGGSATAYVGNYQSFVRQRAEQRLAQRRAFSQQQKLVEQESEYIARNIAGQNSRQAKGRRKRLERMPRLSAPVTEQDAMVLRFEPRQRGGDVVVKAERVTLAVGERTLVEDFDGVVRRRDVLGFLGPNGSGKTTLLRALFGEQDLRAGELRLGSSIEAGYYRQDLSQVPLDQTLYEVIAGLRHHWERRLIQGHLGRFGFSGDEVQRRTDTLSGGERARVALAMLMLSGANLLVLDEPTNHLDVESIEALEDAIDRYDGTVILVSHDRELLRAVTTRVWVLHERHITEFDGSFGEWEVVSAERAHSAAVQAAEDVALRRVHEKERVAAQSRREYAERSARRRERQEAQREVALAEADVLDLERQLAAIGKALEDPALYLQHDGASHAIRLGRRLDDARRSLDAALERWTRATDRLEQMDSDAVVSE